VNPPEWKISEVHNLTSHVLRDFDGPDSLQDFGVRESQMLTQPFLPKYYVPEFQIKCHILF
jgi:hypothetical protein